MTTGAGSQLSVALLNPVLEGSVLSSHSMVILAAQVVMVGGVLSSTVMTCVQFVPFPHASVAVQVLVIVYSCGHPPATVASL